LSHDLYFNRVSCVHHLPTIQQRHEKFPLAFHPNRTSKHCVHRAAKDWPTVQGFCRGFLQFVRMC
jgi:hypothetical protein